MQNYEEESSRFYENLSRRFELQRDLFSSFANEGKMNKIMLVRTYQETITDALETQFAFKGLDLNRFMPRVT